ncbi:MAG: hypothetical protein ACRDRN_01370 [Sciscionella sp.]
MDQPIAISVERWLDVVERNKQMWLAPTNDGALPVTGRSGIERLAHEHVQYVLLAGGQ